VYQMLREFPAHLFGMEGPQACLLLASILGAIAFAIPLLDRNAAKGKRSPLFTDLGVAGLLFFGFLTLKAWDVGVHAPPGQDPAGNPAMAATIARTAALWILGIGLAVTALRRLRWGHSAFSFTAAVLLQAALNGFAHLSWLASGGAALALLAVLFLTGRVRRGGALAPRARRALHGARGREGGRDRPRNRVSAGACRRGSLARGFSEALHGSGQENGPRPEREGEGTIPEPAQPRAGAVLRGGEGRHAVLGGPSGNAPRPRHRRPQGGADPGRQLRP